MQIHSNVACVGYVQPLRKIMYQAALQRNREYWGKPAFLQKRFIGKAF